MKYKIGNVIKIKDVNNEIIEGHFLIIKSKTEQPTKKQIDELAGKHNILNLNDFLDKLKISTRDYIVVKIYPAPYPTEVDEPAVLSIIENEIINSPF